VVDNGIARVTRCEKHLEVRQENPRLVRDLGPRQSPGKHHVGEEKINMRLPLEEAQGRRTIVSFDNAVPKLSQGFHRIGADVVIILDDEDRFSRRAFRNGRFFI
jgi:hypothetical protein